VFSFFHGWGFCRPRAPVLTVIPLAARN
jgi:hypothetical protein